jgi:hypothetical protein
VVDGDAGVGGGRDGGRYREALRGLWGEAGWADDCRVAWGYCGGKAIHNLSLSREYSRGYMIPRVLTDIFAALTIVSALTPL